MRDMKEIIRIIAKRSLGITTLETRNSDRLDFYDVSCSSVRESLEDAYLAGYEAGKRENLTKN